MQDWAGNAVRFYSNAYDGEEETRLRGFPHNLPTLLYNRVRAIPRAQCVNRSLLARKIGIRGDTCMVRKREERRFENLFPSVYVCLDFTALAHFRGEYGTRKIFSWCNRCEFKLAARFHSTCVWKRAHGSFLSQFYVVTSFLFNLASNCRCFNKKTYVTQWTILKSRITFLFLKERQ